MEPHKQYRSQGGWRIRAARGVRAAALALMMQSALRAATVIWDGGAGTGAWGSRNNWSTNTVPGTSDSLVFNATSAGSQYAITLGSNRTTAGITFSAATGTNAFTFSGNTLTVNAGGITNNDTETQTFNSTVSVSSAQTWNAASGGLTFGSVTLARNLTLSGSSGIAITGTLTNSGGNRTITNNSSGTVTIDNINLSNNSTNRTLTIGGTGDTTISGVISNGSSSSSSLAITGTGTLTFGAGMDLSDGTLVLSGGTLNLGGYTSTVGSLSVTADSILDFGSGSSSVLTVLNALTVNSGVTLTIANWADTVDYFYSLVSPGAANLGRIVFNGFTSSSTTWQSFDYQVTPVPELKTYGAALLLLGLAFGAWQRARRNP